MESSALYVIARYELDGNIALNIETTILNPTIEFGVRGFAH
jgi:hypothetical protein